MNVLDAKITEIVFEFFRRDTERFLIGYIFAEQVIFVIGVFAAVWAVAPYWNSLREGVAAAFGLFKHHRNPLPQKMREVIARCAALAAAVGVSQVWKPLIALVWERPRPLIGQFLETDASFPSNHTAAACVMVCVVYLFEGKRAWRQPLFWAILLLAGAVGFGRIALGVHYVSDVLGGVLFGFLSAAIARKGVFSATKHFSAHIRKK